MRRLVLALVAAAAFLPVGAHAQGIAAFPGALACNGPAPVPALGAIGGTLPGVTCGVPAETFGKPDLTDMYVTYSSYAEFGNYGSIVIPNLAGPAASGGGQVTIGGYQSAYTVTGLKNVANVIGPGSDTREVAMSFSPSTPNQADLWVYCGGAGLALDIGVNLTSPTYNGFLVPGTLPAAPIPDTNPLFRAAGGSLTYATPMSAMYLLNVNYVSESGGVGC